MRRRHNLGACTRQGGRIYAPKEKCQPPLISLKTLIKLYLIEQHDRKLSAVGISFLLLAFFLSLQPMALFCSLECAGEGGYTVV